MDQWVRRGGGRKRRGAGGRQSARAPIEVDCWKGEGGDALHKAKSTLCIAAAATAVEASHSTDCRCCAEICSGSGISNA